MGLKEVGSSPSPSRRDALLTAMAALPRVGLASPSDVTLLHDGKEKARTTREGLLISDGFEPAALAGVLFHERVHQLRGDAEHRGPVHPRELAADRGAGWLLAATGASAEQTQAFADTLLRITTADYPHPQQRLDAVLDGARAQAQGESLAGVIQDD